MGFFANLAKEFKQRNYIKGYDWAAGSLLRGGLTSEEVRRITFGHSDPFDHGALAAVRRFEKMEEKQ